MKPNTSEPGEIKNFSSHESLLIANSKLIAHLQDRLKTKRWRPQEGDSSKLAYMRIYLQALQLQGVFLKNLEVDAIKQELEELRELVKNQSCNQGSINGRSK